MTLTYTIRPHTGVETKYIIESGTKGYILGLCEVFSRYLNTGLIPGTVITYKCCQSNWVLNKGQIFSSHHLTPFRVQEPRQFGEDRGAYRMKPTTRARLTIPLVEIPAQLYRPGKLSQP